MNYDPETNSAVDKKLRRYDLNCSYCRPHRGENASRKPTHGTQKPRSRGR